MSIMAGVDILFFHRFAVEVAGDVVKSVLLDGLSVELLDHGHRHPPFTEAPKLHFGTIALIRKLKMGLEFVVQDEDIRFLLDIR